MDQHRKMLIEVLEKGSWSEHSRTGVKTRHIFGRSMSYDLREGIPLITTRAVPWKNSIKEHLWMVSGSVDNRTLLDQKVPVWRLWDLRPEDLGEREDLRDARGRPVTVGSCGPIYGAMWRHWPSEKNPETGIDQLAYLIQTLKTNPTSRRIIVSAWNPDVLPDESLTPQQNVLQGKQCLAPCHTLFQVSTVKLNVYERLEQAVYWMGEESASYPCTKAIATSLKSFLTASHKRLKKAYPGLLGRILYKRKHGYLPRFTDSDAWLPKSYATAMHRTLDLMEVPSHRLDMQLYARSQDLPLGTVFNQFAYASFLQMIAAQVGMFPGTYRHTMGDVHIYENQLPGVYSQIKRQAKPFPVLRLKRKPSSIFEYTIDDFEVVDYNPHPKIIFPLTK